jgi:hypothetical protein
MAEEIFIPITFFIAIVAIVWLFQHFAMRKVPPYPIHHSARTVVVGAHGEDTALRMQRAEGSVGRSRRVHRSE